MFICFLLQGLFKYNKLHYSWIKRFYFESLASVSTLLPSDFVVITEYNNSRSLYHALPTAFLYKKCIAKGLIQNEHESYLYGIMAYLDHSLKN